MPQNFYELELNDCDSLRNWGAFDGIPPNPSGYTEAFGINYTGQVQGTACINFNIDFDGADFSGIGGMYNSNIGTHNIENYNDIKFNLYLRSADVAGVQGATARVGTDTANYNFWNLTTGQLTGVSSSSANTDGYWRDVILSSPSSANASGTVDLNNINYISFAIDFSSTTSGGISIGNIRLDNWRAVKNFDSKYDVELDGQGYQLLQQEGSYNRANQPYSVDRYSTGDITYSNFDIYQYHSQTDWSGGFNDEFGLQENTFWDGRGLDTSEVGKIKNQYGISFVTAAANTGLVTAIQEYKQSAFFGITAGANSSFIYSWPGTGNNLTLQYSVERSAIQDMLVFQNNLWVSVGEPYTTPNQMAMFDGATWSAVNQSAGFMAELGDSLYTMDQSSRMRSFDGTTWTTEFTHTGWYGHRMVTWRDKIYYLASTGDPRFTRQERCALYSYDGVDRLLIQEFDGWCKNSIAVYNNKLYFVVNGILLSYDGENINNELDLSLRYPREVTLDIYSLVSDLGAGIQSISNKLHLVQNSASATTTSQILTSSGNGFTPGFYVGSTSGDTNHFTALGVYTISSEKRLLLGTANGKVYVERSSSAGSDEITGYYDSGWIDANLFSIDKIFKSIQIYFDSLSVYAENLTIQYILDNEDDTFVTLDKVDAAYQSGSTYVEFNFPPNTVGKKLRYRIILGGDSITTQGGGVVTTAVTNVSIKYLLAPDTKHKWNIRVMMPNNLLLNSGIRDVDNGETLANTLWASRIKKEVLQYKDIDNQIYNVIVNDVSIQGPYNVQTGRDSMGTNPEYVASIELLEA